MTSARITINATPGITPQQARDTRARAWRYVFDCHAKKKATRPGGPDDGKETKNVPATKNYTE
jgi:hypothetical protein